MHWPKSALAFLMAGSLAAALLPASVAAQQTDAAKTDSPQASTQQASASPATSQQTDEQFLTRFQGEWKGSGFVRTRTYRIAHPVNCSVRGKTSSDKLDLNGTCTAYLVFTRDIGANLALKPDGRYSGVYIGAKKGPSQLAGTRSDNTITLTVTWPKKINGDRTATLKIRNDSGGMHLEIWDRDKKSGDMVRTAALTFHKD